MSSKRVYTRANRSATGSGATASVCTTAHATQYSKKRFSVYLRAPRLGPFRAVCRRFALLRFGLEIRKVPLPKFSAR